MIEMGCRIGDCFVMRDATKKQRGPHVNCRCQIVALDSCIRDQLGGVDVVEMLEWRDANIRL